jgi:formate hydrogenlyase transcriptional activator
LFHELLERLQRVVRFDHLGLVLHDAATGTMRVDQLEGTQPLVRHMTRVSGVDDGPAGVVLRTQQPLVISDDDAISQWPSFAERVRPYGMQSFCFLPLTTARRRLGAPAFGSNRPGAYAAANFRFLQQVANQVAVAVENTLAFDEIQALKDKLHREKVYLEEEIRTEHNNWRDRRNAKKICSLSQNRRPNRP